MQIENTDNSLPLSTLLRINCKLQRRINSLVSLYDKQTISYQSGEVDEQLQRSQSDWNASSQLFSKLKWKRLNGEMGSPFLQRRGVFLREWRRQCPRTSQKNRGISLNPMLMQEVHWSTLLPCFPKKVSQAIHEFFFSFRHSLRRFQPFPPSFPWDLRRTIDSLTTRSWILYWLERRGWAYFDSVSGMRFIWWTSGSLSHLHR